MTTVERPRRGIPLEDEEPEPLRRKLFRGIEQGGADPPAEPVRPHVEMIEPAGRNRRESLDPDLVRRDQHLTVR